VRRSYAAIKLRKLEAAALRTAWPPAGAAMGDTIEVAIDGEMRKPVGIATLLRLPWQLHLRVLCLRWRH
jgi:hypothetical protein